MMQINKTPFQTKFGARCRAWNMAPYNHEAPPSIQLRLDDDLNLPPTINDRFVIENKKDILEYDMRLNHLLHIEELSIFFSLCFQLVHAKIGYSRKRSITESIDEHCNRSERFGRR